VSWRRRSKNAAYAGFAVGLLLVLVFLFCI
jgi:hypothetical protein